MLGKKAGSTSMHVPKPSKPHRTELENIRFGRDPEAQRIEKLKLALQKMINSRITEKIDRGARD
jgi:hypothetical protein